MMIRYVKHHEINREKWDKCIEDANYSILYAYSWYLDIVSPGWNALIDKDYDTVFPLTSKKKYGLSYLTQPVFAQQLGIFSRHLLNDYKLQEFLQAIPWKFLHYDINLNPLNFLYQLQFRYGSRMCKTYHLSLIKSYNRIFSNYSNDTKRNIRLISKKNFVLKPVPLDDVIDLYKKNVWFKTPALKSKDFITLKKLIEAVASRKKVMILGAFEHHILSAGTIFFICNDKIIFIFGASNKTGRKNGAMRFIFDQIIRKNCNKDMVLDFEGSSVKSVEYFYKSFGSEKITFLNVNFSQFRLLGNIIVTKQILSKMIARQKIKKLFPQNSL